MDMAALPFAWDRGETFFQGGATDSTSGEEYVGKIFKVKFPGTGDETTLLTARNVGAATAPPGVGVRFKAGKFGREFDFFGGGTSGFDSLAFPVLHLHTNGIPVNDIGFIVVGGRARWKSSMTNYAANIAAGAALCVQSTNLTTGHTGAGRFAAISFDAATTIDQTPNLQKVMNQIGYAISSCLTSNTNAFNDVYIIPRMP